MYNYVDYIFAYIILSYFDYLSSCHHGHYLASCILSMLVRLTPLMIVVVDIHTHAPVLGC